MRKNFQEVKNFVYSHNGCIGYINFNDGSQTYDSSNIPSVFSNNVYLLFGDGNPENSGGLAACFKNKDWEEVELKIRRLLPSVNYEVI